MRVRHDISGLSSPAFLRAFAALVPLLALLLTSACSTTREVQQIVADANLATLSSQFGVGFGLTGLDPKQAAGSGTNWQEASQRIQAYVDAHPNDKTTIASLRLRQALLLLHNRVFNLADAAFKEVSAGDLHTARDKSLLQLKDELLWWYKIADGRISRTDVPTANAARVRIRSVQNALTDPADESIRDWLNTWQAWIGIKIANDEMDNPQVSHDVLINAVDSFASTLPAGETARWLTETNWPPAQLKSAEVFGGSIRRRFRADSLIEGARTAITQNEIRIQTNDIRDPYFQRGIFKRP